MEELGIRADGKGAPKANFQKKSCPSQEVPTYKSISDWFLSLARLGPKTKNKWINPTMSYPDGNIAMLAMSIAKWKMDGLSVFNFSFTLEKLFLCLL